MTSSPRPSGARLPVRAGLALAAVVVLTRLPFVGAGYGTDTDTWKFASAIRDIAASGTYALSRPPGYPLMEWSCAPFASLGAWVPNTLSAVAAAACAWLAARLFARHGVRDALLAGAAVVCIPAAWIASVSSIDYLWALAFVLAAWLDAGEGRAARSGLWLGMAIGTRLTSAPLLLPLAWLVWHAARGSHAARMRAVLMLSGLAALIGAAWYVPAWLRYGWKFLSYSEIRGGQSSALALLTGMVHPGSAGVPVALIAGQSTVLLWGVLGCAAIGLALLSIVWQPRTAPRAATLGAVTAWAAAAAVAYELVLYVRLPHDEGYLLPIVPFVLLGLATQLTPTRLRYVGAALVLSPFVFGVDVDPPKKGLSPASESAFEIRLPVSRETVIVEPFRGAALRDLAKRQRMQDVARQLQAWWPTRPAQFRLASGNLVAMMYYLFPADSHAALYARNYTADEVVAARASGIPVYVLPEVAERLRGSDGPHAVDGMTPLPRAEERPR